MKNIVLITSIIRTPNLPLSYTNTRSVYSPEDRFIQTKYTIETIKNKIPNSYIILVECSYLNEDETLYFNNNCNHVINLIDTNCKKFIYSPSKAAGEGTMTIKALEYIMNSNITFDNFFKISGRYFLNKDFNINHYTNDYNVVKKTDSISINTSLYKLNHSFIHHFLHFLKNNYNQMIKCIGYEMLFKQFTDQLSFMKYINILGCSGNIAVSGELVSA
jgi:hypothetical protein